MDLDNAESFFGAADKGDHSASSSPRTSFTASVTTSSVKDSQETSSYAPRPSLPPPSRVPPRKPPTTAAGRQRQHPPRHVVPSSPLHDAANDTLDNDESIPAPLERAFGDGIAINADDQDDDTGGSVRRNSSATDVAQSFLPHGSDDGDGARRGASRCSPTGAGSSVGGRGGEDSAVFPCGGEEEEEGVPSVVVKDKNNFDFPARSVPSSASPAIIAHSQSHDGILSSSPKDAQLEQLQQQQQHPQHPAQHFRPHHVRQASAGGDSLSGSKLPHKNLLTYTMEDQAMLMKTRMRSLSLPYALKVKSPETIAKESGEFHEA